MRYSLRILSLVAISISLTGGGALAAPTQVRGWLVHEPDAVYLDQVVKAAAQHHINHLEFSHDIVMQADEIADDPERARLVESVAKRAKAQGIRCYIWTHEINAIDKNIVLDPITPAGKAFWESRRNAYRRALRACPSLAGVVLMFGSSPQEIWDRPSTPGTGDGWQQMTMPDRVRFVTHLVQEVVHGEFHGEIFVRDFNHGPEQLDSLTEALRNWPGITVISKSEPQDFQPFYPHSASIGAFGTTPQIIEMDLCGEYWGQSVGLVSLAEYIPYRLKYDTAKGTVGAVGRIDRFENRVLGTPSELNLFAFERTLADPTINATTLYNEWCAQRYRLKKGSPEAMRLSAIFARTLPIAKKTYYTLGFWTWKSLSTIPDKSSSIDSGIRGKSTAQWDPTAKRTEEKLLRPDTETVRAILAEKEEAIRLAQENITALPTLKAHLSISDYDDLAYRLHLTVDIAHIYATVADAYWKVRLLEQNNGMGDIASCRAAIAALGVQSDYLESHNKELASIASQAPHIRALQEDLTHRLNAL